jgi:hypothetical protein
MLTDQHIEEGLSRAYVRAIASRAGVNIGGLEFDYGMDGTFRTIYVINRRRVTGGFSIDFQLKASTRWILDDIHIRYDLEAKTYNDLVTRSNIPRAAPLILVLLCLPVNPEQWLENNEEQLVLRKCCYWTRLVGTQTNNTESHRIRIPRDQLLTSESLTSMLRLVENGVSL